MSRKVPYLRLNKEQEALIKQFSCNTTRDGEAYYFIPVGFKPVSSEPGVYEAIDSWDLPFEILERFLDQLLKDQLLKDQLLKDK